MIGEVVDRAVLVFIFVRVLLLAVAMPRRSYCFEADSIISLRYRRQILQRRLSVPAEEGSACPLFPSYLSCLLGVFDDPRDPLRRGRRALASVLPVLSQTWLVYEAYRRSRTSSSIAGAFPRIQCFQKG